MRGKIFKISPDKSCAMVVGAGVVSMSSSASGRSGGSDGEGCSASGAHLKNLAVVY